MKSALKKSVIRSIVNGLFETLSHPEWWGDKTDDFYAPYVNEAAKLGIRLETWSYTGKKCSGTFETALASFVYTYVTKSGKKKNDIGYIYINSREDDFSAEVHESEDIKISFKRSPLSKPSHGNVSLFNVKVSDKENVFEDAMPLISDYLKDFHQAKLLFAGSMSKNRDTAIQNAYLMIHITESFWSYALGKSKHLYKCSKFNPEEEFLGLQQIEISESELARFTEDYEMMSKRILCSCGAKTFKDILKGFKENSLERKTR